MIHPNPVRFSIDSGLSSLYTRHMPEEVVRYNNCFICGPNNPVGLNLKFLAEGNRAWTDFVPDLRHEGYKGILHGGIIAAVLDEVMIKSILATGTLCVTAAMETRFRAPALLGSRFHFEAIVTSVRGRIINAAGTMKDEKGNLVASATGKYMTVSAEMQSKLNESLSI